MLSTTGVEQRTTANGIDKFGCMVSAVLPFWESVYVLSITFVSVQLRSENDRSFPRRSHLREVSKFTSEF